MKRYLTTFILVFAAALCYAQNEQDSLLIASAEWQITRDGDSGITHRSAQIKGLYGGVQSINVVEIPRTHKGHFGIEGNKGMRPTSRQAAENNALAAINGSYYNMKVGNSVCFYKVDKEVIDSTATSEFDNRANGAVKVHKRKVQIIEWSKAIEQNYRGKRGSVLVSGPMLLFGGELSDWSRCSKSFVQTRHPRSALLVTRRGDVIMLTVDGRSKGNADGMSIPELAFLAKQLGAVEAINLDGGGSTTLWLRGEGVVNYPCDNGRFDHEGERSVSNAIYVM